ncbi:MAG: carbon starvation protein A [Bacteroidales bacterium]|nr:carbon starvation protein A [Bacteroidales bacterium]MBQ8462125.1 carbon starvation protein A [Bacteroidales bacterium]MDT3361742.1 carbon starvation protein A [Bacteroidota bacterium]
MISFLLCVLALILGYLVYGRFIDKVFGSDPKRVTPAVSKADGIDYIAMPTWKVFMIQFLNIAGTGPIFGAIMGAKFGPSSYLWIVLGCIFAGAVHDYLTGMLSLRHDGAGLPEIIGTYLGKTTKGVMLAFTVLLLLLVGAVFVYSPAEILKSLAGDGSDTSFMIWVAIIFAYYIIATMLPIDKIIGKIYPVFAVALLFMAAGLMVGLFVKWPAIPEIWDGLANRTSAATPIFPCLFITIACGAISGFHATQSPLMARCLKNEKLGRPVFYGSMITEGLVALVWAAVSSYFFFDGGAEQVGGSASSSAPQVVELVSKNWLGVIGGILAILGVVAAPITSGDTALRSGRLIIADALHFEQKPIKNRLAISIPIFIIVALLLWFNMANQKGFDNIWGYFGWANQTLAVFSLWAVTVYLKRAKKGYYWLITCLPAIFMTVVSITYLFAIKLHIFTL